MIDICCMRDVCLLQRAARALGMLRLKNSRHPLLFYMLSVTIFCTFQILLLHAFKKCFVVRKIHFFIIAFRVVVALFTSAWSSQAFCSSFLRTTTIAVIFYNDHDAVFCKPNPQCSKIGYRLVCSQLLLYLSTYLAT